MPVQVEVVGWSSKVGDVLSLVWTVGVVFACVCLALLTLAALSIAFRGR